MPDLQKLQPADLLQPCPRCAAAREAFRLFLVKHGQQAFFTADVLDEEGHPRARRQPVNMLHLECGQCRNSGRVPTPLGQLLMRMVETYGADARPLTEQDRPEEIPF